MGPFFSDFQYGLGLLDLLQIFSQLCDDRIARAFNRSGAIPAVALDIS